MSTKITKTILWILIISMSAYFFITFIAPYFGLWNEQLDERRISEISWLITHFSFGFFALFLAPFQFIPQIRNNYPRVHHTIGKIYIIGAVVSSLIVFYLLSNYELPGSIPSLAFLDIIWPFTTIAAYLLARRNFFKVHKKFMIRSYVCALAFVYLRLFDKIDHMTGAINFITNDETQATVIEWMWIYPLVITEFFLQWLQPLKKMRLQKIKDKNSNE